MTKIKWVDEPPAARRQTKWVKLCAPLKEHPGRWAMFENVWSTVSTNIRTGRTSFFAPAGSWETTMRNVTDGWGDMYVRYVGEAGDDVSE